MARNDQKSRKLHEFSRWLSFAAVLGTMSLAPVPMMGQNTELSLEFDPYTVLQQGSVSFTRAHADPVSGVFPNDKDDSRGYTRDGKYELIIDHSSYRFNQFGNYTFTAYAQLLHPPSTRWQFYVTARPQGIFPDTQDAVSFHLRSGTSDSTDVILMPIHSIGANDLLSPSKSMPEIQNVGISGNTPPILNVESNLPGFALQITQIEVSSNQCGKGCWARLAGPGDLIEGGAGRRLDSKGQDTIITLDARPKTFSALKAGALHFKMNDPHEKLTVRVTYAPIAGGRSRYQDFELPVRFTPSVWMIFSSIGLGLAIGIGLRRMFVGAHAIGRRDLGKIIFGTALIELIFDFAVSADRPLVLLGVSVDPIQPVPAFLIALLISGGPPVTQFISQMIVQGSATLGSFRSAPQAMAAQAGAGTSGDSKPADTAGKGEAPSVQTRRDSHDLPEAG